MYVSEPDNDGSELAPNPGCIHLWEYLRRVVFSHFLLQNSETFWPGLGSSETAYAWVLMAYYISKMTAMPITGLMAQKMPYKPTILITLSLYMVSGVLYGQATTVWMVIVSRSLMGVCSGLSDATELGYIGEMGTRMDKIREGKRKQPMKNVIFVAYSFSVNGATILAFGML